MSNALRTLAFGAILVMAAACGTAGATDDGAPADEPVVEVPGGSAGMCAPDVPDCIDVVVDPEPGGPMYRPIEPEGDMAGDGRVVSGGELVSVDGTQVVVGFWMGVEDCFAVESVEVVETSEAVSVDIVVAPRAVDQMCIEIAEARSVVVDLEAPLGDRALTVGGIEVTG